MALYHDWFACHAARLHGLSAAEESKKLIRELAEDLLQRFAAADLIDPYAVYQLLLDYWRETMQDDAYLIIQDGWQTAGQLREMVNGSGQKSRETPDFRIGRKRYKADLIPPALLVARYFAGEQAAIEELETQKEVAGQELAALIEEHSGEEGLLAEAISEAGNVTKTTLNARLRAINQEAQPDPEELAVLQECKAFMEAEARTDKKLKAAQEDLEKWLFSKYPRLNEAEIKTLVVADKWQADLASTIQAEIERVTQALAGRVKLLEERYTAPLPQIIEEMIMYSTKVESHLKKMGVTK
jgi:type I restriction enzyme M protein